MAWEYFSRGRLSGEFEELVLAQGGPILCAGWELHSHVSDRLWDYVGEYCEGRTEWMPETIR